MEKQEKLFWRYFVPVLAFIEVATFLVFIHKPFLWNFIRLGFILFNGSILIYLVNVKIQVEKFNAEQGVA
jgi:hypothetical protein